MTRVHSNKNTAQQTEKKRLTALIILDGFGLADIHHPGNAITPTTAPHLFSYMEEYPHTTLDTTGEAVGLFPGQKGNSEAGHLTIGTGRVVKQDLVRISDAIHNGTFFKNEAFKQALHHAKKYHTAVHVMTLLTDSNSAHAYPEHVYALLEYFRREKYDNVFLHLFTDGRDSSPHSAPTFLHELRGHMLANEKIASIMGRYYAMDRNKTWERTKVAYEAMIMGKGNRVSSAEAALEQAYNRGETDEYISPTIIEENGKPVATIQDNDVIYFINARSDRARQLTKVFVQPDFVKKNPGAFRRNKLPKNLRFVAMTDFGPDLPGVFTAFPSPDIPNAIARAIDGAYHQLYISETEKYAHVTYFINGGYAEAIDGETRELVPSGVVRSYAERPEMHSKEMVDSILAHIQRDGYNFICTNFPNADMVGHTGDFAAAKKAVHALDTELHRLVEAVLARDGQVLIVADHGNAEEMINEKTKEIMTEHTKNPVPCIMIRRDTRGVHLRPGALADVAPTLLKMMDVPQPEEMTGVSLF